MSDSIINWENIAASVESCLLKSRYWSDHVANSLERLKANLDAQQRSMPTITAMKRAGGNLVIFTVADTPQDVVDYIDQICGDCGKLCEECGNAAYVQHTTPIRRLCSWCYAKGAPWIRDLDVATEFPDLVSDNTASLVPATGRGWYAIIRKRLAEMRDAVREADLAPGMVQISDIKTKLGSIRTGFHSFHDSIDPIDQQLHNDSLLTCCRCGHVGERARAFIHNECVCNCCAVFDRYGKSDA
ncbi:hypothetical protein C1J03_18695 [Sulfitobacter sp. SK012]|uniref:hypothetical protein n=1 Tax=Sulfitobacter sp. SK012 TaxID=1389005 RepID=UPI000E0AB9F2|nr:hypothetical protein [Sulfitobacter sp. SK012]AXI47857.1 hypothetical protein C1J03_18695 [Sulfitobacter sp. SK012]